MCFSYWVWKESVCSVPCKFGEKSVSLSWKENWVLPGLERSNVKSCCRNASSRKTSVPLCAARSRESRVYRVAKSGQKIFSQSSRKPCTALISFSCAAQTDYITGAAFPLRDVCCFKENMCCSLVERIQACITPTLTWFLCCQVSCLERIESFVAL